MYSERVSQDKRYLEGLRILVTRNRERVDKLSRQLRRLGAHPVPFPTITIRPVRHPSLKGLKGAETVLFTSTTAVDLFFKHAPASHLEGKKVAAVGPATAAALDARGVRVHLRPRTFTSEAIARRLKGRVFHPAADKSNPDLPRLIPHYTRSVFYRILRPRRRPIPKADLVTFASAQTARNYADLGGDRSLPAACIGPVTARAVRGLGMKIIAQPRRYTIPDLVSAIVQWRRG